MRNEREREKRGSLAGGEERTPGNPHSLKLLAPGNQMTSLDSLGETEADPCAVGARDLVSGAVRRPRHGPRARRPARAAEVASLTVHGSRRSRHARRAEGAWTACGDEVRLWTRPQRSRMPARCPAAPGTGGASSCPGGRGPRSGSSGWGVARGRTSRVARRGAG